MADDYLSIMVNNGFTYRDSRTSIMINMPIITALEMKSGNTVSRLTCGGSNIDTPLDLVVAKTFRKGNAGDTKSCYSRSRSSKDILCSSFK